MMVAAILPGRAMIGPAIALSPPGVANPVTMLVAVDTAIRCETSEAISHCGLPEENRCNDAHRESYSGRSPEYAKLGLSEAAQIQVVLLVVKFPVLIDQKFPNKPAPLLVRSAIKVLGVDLIEGHRYEFTQ